jgi:hypothetical protein
MAYRFEEELRFHPIVRFSYLVMLIVFLASVIRGLGGPHPRPPIIPILVGLGLLVLPLLFGRLTIRVGEENLTATWGYFGWPQQVIPLSTISDAEIITYNALRQFGGWGIRWGRIDGESTSCYTLRGNRGVLLTLAEDIRVSFARTQRFLLGSQDPERLQQALGK